MERREPLHHHQEQKPLRAQRETWFQHLCSSKDLQKQLHEAIAIICEFRKSIKKELKSIWDKKKRTNFNGSDAKTTGLKDDPYAAGGDAFAEATDHSSADQNILHSCVMVWGMEWVSWVFLNLSAKCLGLYPSGKGTLIWWERERGAVQLLSNTCVVTEAVPLQFNK